jgi:hypothetical protein
MAIKIKLLTYHMSGWIVEFSGEETKSIRDYCKKENEKIEWFFGGPNEEETVREVVGEGFDMFEYCGSWHNDNANYVPKFGGCKIIVEDNGQDKDLSIDNINIEEDIILIDEWKKNNKGKDTIAYSFGYESDDLLEIEFKLDSDDFDASKLTMSIVKNEFYPYSYIGSFKYDGKDCDWGDIEDFDGEYYNTEYFESK